MKRCLHAFGMCHSMFCAFPFPWHGWDENAREIMLLFLPLIGLELGIVLALLAWLCRILAVPQLITAVLLCTYPFFSTGFMHLDGFMDVTDAVRSYRDLERRREILKDSHVGSFAVIAVVILLLVQFAVFASASETYSLIVLALIPAFSRCCSIMAVNGLRTMSTSQYAACEKKTAYILIPAGIAAGLLLTGFLIGGKCGFALLGCAVGYGLALLRAFRSLQGMNGDISGYAISIGELCAAAVLVLV